MSSIWVGFDPNAPQGEQLPPEVVEEIKRVAPSAVENGAITTNKLRDDAVTSDKLAPGAVDALALALDAVVTLKIKDKAVTTGKIDDAAVTASKAGVGVVTSYDSTGAAISRKEVDLTAAQYAALAVKDPNTYYNVFG